jgi:tetratricopeptide (TPR) repeat protein
MAYEKKNSYQQAIKHFKRAVEIKPAFSKPYLNLGNLYLGKLNDKRNALRYLKKWLKLAPNHPDSDSIRKKIDRIKKGSIG